MKNNFQVLPFSTIDVLVKVVAQRWLDDIAAAQSQGTVHTVALSGGRIATKLFTTIVAQSQARGISFEHVHFFWADERCVPPGDAESNFRVAKELLLAPLKISAGQIHRILGEENPEGAAEKASAELLQVVPAKAGAQPVLDVVILGMGEDGHIASLFPTAGAEVLNCTTPFLAIHNSPKPPPTRISLSYATIAAARNAWVLAAGAGKEKALHDSVCLANQTPMGRLLGLRADTQVYTDLKIPADLPVSNL